MTSEVEYEDYSSKFEDYDKMRTTPAWPIIQEAINMASEKTLGLPVGELVVLDAGCGTGLYTDKVKDIVKQVIALDQNEGMLKRCAEKFTKVPNVTVKKASLLEKLSLADHSVHVVMINQVLHHLESPDTFPSWLNTKALMEEFNRVLVPGGLLAINHCPDDQIINGLWYYGLFPEISKEVQDKFVKLHILEEILVESGFQNVKSSKSVELTLKPELVYNLENILDENFRNTDSFWSLVPKVELELVLKKWKEMLKTNKAKEFLTEREKLLKESGHMCETVCTKKRV